MARFFNSAASEYAVASGVPVTGMPLTMACWVNVAVMSGDNMVLAMLSDGPGSANYYILHVDTKAAGDAEVDAIAKDSGGQDMATTAAPLFDPDTWVHVAAVFESATSRAAYLNGGQKGTNATSISPTGIDTCEVARHSAGGLYLYGGIAELVIYDVALSDREVRLLAQGVPPWRIRPNHAYGFWFPFGDHTDRDFSGRGYHLTAYNTPTWAPDPPVVISRYMRNRYRRTDDRGMPWWRVLARSPLVIPVIMQHRKQQGMS